jgi:predicted adenylyl cyclase CyaB
MLEIEAKLYLHSEAAARDLCRRLELPWQEGVRENNRIFDFPDGRLARRGALVRVRERGATGFLTFKEKSAEKVSHAKVRHEYETEITRPAAACQLLSGLGLVQKLSYERYRARHRAGGAHVEIDHLPGGWFCEIEGSPEQIRDLRLAAGLERESQLVWSYPEIFEGLRRSWPEAGSEWSFEAFRRGAFALPPPGDPFWDRARAESQP